MSTYQQSSAVKLEWFSPDLENETEQPGLSLLPEQQTRNRPLAAVAPYGKYLFIIACVFTVLLGIVFNDMKLAAIRVENNQLKNQITQMDSEQNALNAKKEQMYNLAYVEDYAVNQLGMVKADKSGTAYLQLDDGDQMLVTEEASAEETLSAESFLGKLTQCFSTVLEYLN